MNVSTISDVIIALVTVTTFLSGFTATVIDRLNDRTAATFLAIEGSIGARRRLVTVADVRVLKDVAAKEALAAQQATSSWLRRINIASCVVVVALTAAVTITSDADRTATAALWALAAFQAGVVLMSRMHSRRANDELDARLLLESEVFDHMNKAEALELDVMYCEAPTQDRIRTYLQRCEELLPAGGVVGSGSENRPPLELLAIHRLRAVLWVADKEWTKGREMLEALQGLPGGWGLQAGIGRLALAKAYEEEGQEEAAIQSLATELTAGAFVACDHMGSLLQPTSRPVWAGAIERLSDLAKEYITRDLQFRATLSYVSDNPQANDVLWELKQRLAR